MPASTTYTSEPYLTTRDGLTISGQLFLPAGTDRTTPLPTLICAHGFAGNYLSCVPYAWALAERGWAVCAFDFCGGGYAVKSEGNPLEMTLLTERDDIRAVVCALADEPFVDERHLCILGDGQGALAATLFAHDHPHVAEALVLLHPAFGLCESTRRTFPTKKNIPASYRHLGMRVGRAFGEVAFDTNPYALMGTYPGPVLVLAGTDDANAARSVLDRAIAAFPEARLAWVPGGRAVFRGSALDYACRLTCEFLADVLADEASLV